MELSSPAFRNGDSIPARHTCDGADVSPAFAITDVPEGTRSFALIVDDPDATRGTPWDHWILWNIPGDARELGENVVPAGARQGMTSFGFAHYGGPCPPRGARPHRYICTLYALDVFLDLPDNSGKGALLGVMEGHILGTATLLGYFGRTA